MHVGPRAHARPQLARARRAPERRRLVDPVRPGGRHADDGRRVALRRPARVGAERGRRLPARGRRGRDRPRAHPGRARRGRRGRPSRPYAGRRDHAFQVAGHRRRGPRIGRALLHAGARARSRDRGRPVIPLAEIEAARSRIPAEGLHSPLLRLRVDEAPCAIWLKLECLQPIGSFKLRGAANAVAAAPPDAVHRGLWTTSAGNMAQGIAWIARELGVPATIVVPDHAPAAKLRAIERLGGTAIPVPFDRWWQAMEEGAFPGLGGHFVHPVRDPAVIAGNGTIGLEIAEQLEDVDAVLVPWGGGGLTTGIASALAAVSPGTHIVACEPETAAAVSAALAAGGPAPV
ncbi:MAG: pyridoxal-phosphate dependent enzyme, partial [Actinobacteria bacterium]|nr:pyridoxal-phosphate dependent enzyme [Actinomycetota bacterium]